MVGGGKMGLSHIAIARATLGNARVIVCDPSWPTRHFYQTLGIPAYRGLDAAIDELGVFAGAIIATPTPSHFELAHTTLGLGVPTFVEKPMTLDVRKSEILVALAAERGVHGQVGFVMRYIPTFNALRQIVRGGDLGAVLRYSATMSGNVVTSSNSSHWRSVFARGGGCLNEYGPHLIDLSRFLFGEITDIRMARKEHVYSDAADDRIEVDWRHESGISGALLLDWCDPDKRKSMVQLSVEFEHGSARVDNSSFEVTVRAGSDVIVPDIPLLTAPPAVRYYLRGEEYSRQIEDFLSVCVGRPLQIAPAESAVPAAGLEDGLKADQLIRQIGSMVGLR